MQHSATQAGYPLRFGTAFEHQGLTGLMLRLQQSLHLPDEPNPPVYQMPMPEQRPSQSVAGRAVPLEPKKKRKYAKKQQYPAASASKTQEFHLLTFNKFGKIEQQNIPANPLRRRNGKVKDKKVSDQAAKSFKNEERRSAAFAMAAEVNKASLAFILNPTPK